MKSKVASMVNLNTNPCKMCMPMGAATALYGIKNCITILHGSQGCATYIRRHMATHYNEPIDIASSSLTEEGTVYGGEKNLKKGLINLIGLYKPQVIGVMTTCLAETIGEDLHGIIERFYEENPQYRDITILPVHSPGYGGTQYEGYFAALNAVAAGVDMDVTPNDCINVILPPASPADVRFIKNTLDAFGIHAVLLPDVSENLDGGHEKEYSRLPIGGTDISMLRKMGGAKYTIEITEVESTSSPAKALFDKYGVPYTQIKSPVGLLATDAFYETLKKVTGKDIPGKIRKARRRYIDAMIDSHKYNAAGRAAIFGEPEFVVSAARLCTENGVLPVVVSTGSVFPQLKKYVEKEIQDVAERYFAEAGIITDDTDFKAIEEYTVRGKANLMIGNSDGRRIAEDLHIPLVRRAFPIHDRVGGQRLRMYGYEGSISFLDEITNALLSVTENTFRNDLFQTLYKGTPIDETVRDSKKEETDSKKEFSNSKKEDTDSKKEVSNSRMNALSKMSEELKKKTLEHPCYNCAGHKFARIHLPVAPSCNVQCNYCLRKYDCTNESRPGVTSTVLSPEAALERYKAVKEKLPNLTVVGIAGPGDALADNYEDTKRTLQLIRAYDKDVTFCLSTNGLMLPYHAEEIAELGVSHVTVTMSAVDPVISGKIYKFINYMGQKYEGDAAGAIMVSNQLAGLRILLAKGVICKVNIVTLKGLNDEHIPEVVRTCKELGCYITNIMQLIPVKGSAFENMPMVSNKEIEKIRTSCNEIMPQMFHCRQCRADAIGTLDNDLSIDLKGFLSENKAAEKTPEKKPSTYAIATRSGINVDMHFGHADEFYIYEYKDGEIHFKEKRNVEKYCDGTEECDAKEERIEKIVRMIADCDGVIAMRIGESPKEQLSRKGIRSYQAFDKIETAIRQAAGQ